MGLNDTPSASRVHIGFFGRRNAGKSSLVNAVTNQELAVVSDVKGTTTDPVSKAMELLPLGPVVIVDTPGFDDSGKLGDLRVRRTKNVLNSIDMAVLVSDAQSGLSECDNELISLFKEKSVPYIIAYNKSDLVANIAFEDTNSIYVSALNKTNISELKNRIAALAPTENDSLHLVGDFIKPSDFVVLITPIDAAAPKGRLILPQQQAVRDILDTGASSIVVRETEFSDTLLNLSKKPSLVVCDSQVFQKAAAETPPQIKLTSFSILMARYKGFLEEAVKGVKAVQRLKDGDKVLISEGCTHHRQCGDIGSVKLPKWLKEFTGCDLKIELSSGNGFPEDLSPYSLIVHCGGCMLTERAVMCRIKNAADQNIPITNYGILIAYMKGILKRSLEIMPELYDLID